MIATATILVLLLAVIFAMEPESFDSVTSTLSSRSLRDTGITTRVTRTMTTSVPGATEDSEEMRESMQKIVDQFMTEERKGQ
ncbi:hypothetical protein TSAR_008989 [Trichomalopsis sarcophagae]|uniref:Uncharacterized protein n=1 Tax=Trichomalopsis sarcophagae TaxID=543379 RepID=A0A232EGC0_9HYME|nr:hypothetical protein TSAR_008989 [Trichomalopsis sarcophagae]